MLIIISMNYHDTHPGVLADYNQHTLLLRPPWVVVAVGSTVKYLVSAPPPPPPLSTNLLEK